MSTALQSVTEKIVTALRGVELFSPLSHRDLERVAEAGKIIELGRGELLFRRGDPPDCIHLLLEGAIEIFRTTPDHAQPIPVAYLSPGEVIGDMAIVTGSVRRSDGRVPERARVWTLSRANFEHLVATIEGYGMALARMFAGRLEGFISHLRRQSGRKELAGRLEHFDLPTVVQTLVSSNQTGILSIHDDGGDAVAEVLLREGAVERSRCGILEGDEAFYEIFLRGEEGEFVFRAVADAHPDSISRVPNTLPAMNLLIDAMRMLDELPALKALMPDLSQPLSARVEQLRWDSPKSEPVARAIFEKLRTPARIADLSGQIPASTHTLYRVVATLCASKQIG